MELKTPKAPHPEQNNSPLGTQRKIVFLSSRGGTGKSILVANIATDLALNGLRIGIIDLDLKSPSLGALFNVDEKCSRLDDFLLGKTSITSCIFDLAKHLNMESGGLFLHSPSPRTTDILTIHKSGYSIDDLALGLKEVEKDLKLDLLLIDTCSGLDEDTLASMLTGDHAIVLTRPDRQSCAGTDTTITILRKLGYAEKGRTTSLIINSVSPTSNLEKIRREFEASYDCQVLTVIPFYADVLSSADGQLLSLKEPAHPFSAKIAEAAKNLLSRLKPLASQPIQQSLHEHKWA